jgi:dTDP-4-dehydrorhamnose reductase
VTGSKGMLGTSVKKVFEDHDLLLTNSTDLDVRNFNQVMAWAKSKPNIILHLAAETDLVRAEFNPSDAYMTNHTGTLNMVNLAETLNVPIVYIGTAGIFDGKKKIYKEEDRANPLHHYGRSKYYGERAVRQYDKHYIVRAGWAMGGGPEVDKKFINKIFKQVSSGVKKLYGIKDMYGNPTYTMDFAMTLKNIVTQMPEYGIYNSGGKGSASRLAVLKEFIKLLGLSKKIEIVPVTDKEFCKMFPSGYPKTGSEVLSIKKLEKLGLSAMRDWQSALAEYAKEFI